MRGPFHGLTLCALSHRDRLQQRARGAWGPLARPTRAHSPAASTRGGSGEFIPSTGCRRCE
eukprot:1632538-Prymnesium_polylepis.1